MPHPSRMRPTARISEKMNAESFSTTTSGSSAAKGGRAKTMPHTMTAYSTEQAGEILRIFVVIQLSFGPPDSFLYGWFHFCRFGGQKIVHIQQFIIFGALADHPPRCRRRYISWGAAPPSSVQRMFGCFSRLYFRSITGRSPRIKQMHFAVVQQPHLVRGHQVAPGLLVVDAVTAVASFVLVVAGGGDGFFPQQFETYLWVSLVCRGRETRRTDRPVIPQSSLYIFFNCAVLHDDGTENGAGTHGGQRRQKVSFGKGNVARTSSIGLMQPGIKRPLCMGLFGGTVWISFSRKSCRPDKLSDLSESGNAAEQCNFAFAQFLQVQLVRHRQLGDGRKVECRKGAHPQFTKIDSRPFCPPLV